MATTVMMRHPATGLVKKGFYGFSWTTWFFSGIPAIMRDDWLTGGILLLIGWTTGTIASFIWAFLYNKKYTLKLIEKGYVFADSPQAVSAAQAALGIGENVGIEKGGADGQQSPPSQPTYQTTSQGQYAQDPTTKFNWVAFWFGPFYYAGYGKFLKGLVFVLLMALPPAGIVIAIYAGKKANKELPVGNVPFKWGPAIGLLCIAMIYGGLLSVAEEHIKEKEALKSSSIVQQEPQTPKNVVVEPKVVQQETVIATKVEKRKASDSVVTSVKVV